MIAKIDQQIFPGTLLCVNESPVHRITFRKTLKIFMRSETLLLHVYQVRLLTNTILRVRKSLENCCLGSNPRSTSVESDFSHKSVDFLRPIRDKILAKVFLLDFINDLPNISTSFAVKSQMLFGQVIALGLLRSSLEFLTQSLICGRMF